MSLSKHIPNTITLMNLLSGIFGVICAVQGWFDIAFPLMLLAAVFDFCDGLAARLLGAYSPVGKELDSLSDLVSFGVLPAIMLVVGMQEEGAAGWYCYLPLFLALMSALRLARFNVDPRQGKDFLGVATPTSALLCGSLTYFMAVQQPNWLCALCGSPWFFPLLAFVLGLLMVSEIPMFGMKIAKGEKLLDARRTVFLLLCVAAVMLTAVLRMDWSLAVLLIFTAYILENLVIWLFTWKTSKSN